MTQQEFFNRYTFNVRTDKIGGGGFGAVYKAYDNVFHREVAIKVSESRVSSDGTRTFSLKDEFDARAHIPCHPNIANYEEFFTFEMPYGLFDFAVMQYYPDGNLHDAISEGLTVQQKEYIAEHLLIGIGFLHQHNVVHRDLKPSNILVVKHKGDVIPIIADFGLSKWTNMTDQSLFRNSFGAGSLHYSSPEQLQGKSLRFNTDLWSYGAILYELFLDKSLFCTRNGVTTAQTEVEVYNKIVNGCVADLNELPIRWRKVAERCLVVDPEKRAKRVEDLLHLGVHDNEGEVWDEDTLKNESSEDTIIMQAAESSVFDEMNINDKCSYFQTTDGEDLVFFVKNVKFVMKFIKGGVFQMGATPEQEGESKADEKPVHPVEVSDFYLGEVPVTQALWKVLMRKNESFFVGDDLPAENILGDRWSTGPTGGYEDFIHLLNLVTGLEFRLPTEAEWEYAARGGLKSKGYKYAGSNDLDEVAWFSDNSKRKTHPVKQKKPNELGLYDMSGNVSEICSDRYGMYDSDYQKNPKRLFTSSRVLRGGNYDYCSSSCRVSCRDSGQNTQLLSWIGFRLALSKK